MKRIPLTQKMSAIIDDNDYIGLNKYKWYAKVGHGLAYEAYNSKALDIFGEYARLNNV